LVKDELSGIRDYIKAIIHRPKRLQQLKDDFEETGGKNFVKPMLDVRTHWNSTVDMIIRAFRLRDGLSVTMESMF
jgi:Glu-tRNA(Gln) amidotransferase subunit E-like FAD-binding protein